MQGEMSGSEKKTDVRQFIQKTCNKEVSYCSPTKQRHRNVQKSVLRVQSCFFANETYCCFSPFSSIAFAA